MTGPTIDALWQATAPFRPAEPASRDAAPEAFAPTLRDAVELRDARPAVQPQPAEDNGADVDDHAPDEAFESDAAEETGDRDGDEEAALSADGATDEATISEAATAAAAALPQQQEAETTEVLGQA